MTDPTPDVWRRVDAYLTQTLVGQDAALDLAVADQNAAGLPAIEVAPVNGKLLNLLARISGARRVLEIGTLGAYSTIWMARGIPEDGLVVTIEAEPRIAEIARANLERAGVAGKVEIKLGRGADVLPTLEGEEPFDLVFIDADKIRYVVYLDLVLRLSRRGTVILADNVIRHGLVMDEITDDESARGARAYNALIAAHPRLESIVLPILRDTVDGLAISIVR